MRRESCLCMNIDAKIVVKLWNACWSPSKMPPQVVLIVGEHYAGYFPLLPSNLRVVAGM